MYRKYRYNAATGCLNEYDAEHCGYVWIAKSRKATAAEAVKEYESGQQYENMLSKRLSAWEI